MNPFLAPELSNYYERFPLMLIDVGASGGVSRRWKPAAKYLRALCFEPDERAFRQLHNTPSAPSITYVNCALHQEKGTVALHLAKAQSASSAFEPNWDVLKRFPEADRFETLQTVPVRVDCLDHQLQENGFSDADFVKVDTQGTELSILQGGQQALRGALFGVEAEVEFLPLYRGQPLFSDVDAYLRGFGFQLFDLRPVFWKRTRGRDVGGSKGQIIFGDALYLRSPETFLKLLDNIADLEARKAKLLRAITVCVLYGYMDYALEVLDAGSHFFPETERRLAEAAIAAGRAGRDRIPDFRGRRRIADLFHSLWTLFEPVQAEPAVRYFREKGWATGLRALGNSDS